MLGSFGLREGVRAQGFVPDRLCREAVGSVVVVQLLSVLVNPTACPSLTFPGEGSLPPRFVCVCVLCVSPFRGGHTRPTPAGVAAGLGCGALAPPPRTPPSASSQPGGSSWGVPHGPWFGEDGAQPCCGQGWAWGSTEFISKAAAAV